MRRPSLARLAPLPCLVVATVLLGSCLASGGTATIAPGPIPSIPTSTPIHMPATATATATVAPTPTSGMPSDFAFRFSVNRCGDLAEIDTFKGTYTAETGGGLERGQVSIALTPAELLVYYSEFVLLDPLSLPASLPYHRLRLTWVEYEFEVRIEGGTKSNFWSGHSWAPTPTMLESRVRRFASSMEKLVQDRPELRELRNRGGGCT